MFVQLQDKHEQDKYPSLVAEFPAPLTQELGNDVHRLSPQEELPVAPAVAGEALLAARALLLQVNKIRRHVVILGDNRTPCGGLK